MLLAGAVIREQCNDYIRIRKGLKLYPHDERLLEQLTEIIDWFHSSDYQRLSCGANPEYILNRLDRRIMSGGGRLHNQAVEPAQYNREMAREGTTSRKGKYGYQICWDCDKAEDQRRCCWAAGIPRKDWVADPVEWVENGYVRQSYDIKYCPAFEAIQE